MKFRFCGDQDCPNWVLLEVTVLSLMTSPRIKIMTQQILSYCLQGTYNHEKLLRLASENADGLNDIKGAVAAVHFIVTNAAKYDINDDALHLEIQQLGLPKENSEAICRGYREHKDNLRTKFTEESYRISKLLRTDWRVDHVITSGGGSTGAEFSGPLVQLKLKVDALPQEGTVTEDCQEINLSGKADGRRVRDEVVQMTGEQLDSLVFEMQKAKSALTNLH